MEDDRTEFFMSIGSPSYTVNITCDYDYVPPAAEYIESLGSFAVVFVSLGAILTFATLYLSIDASYSVTLTKKSRSLKRNILLILSVYPVASLCSLIALAIPRFGYSQSTRLTITGSWPMTGISILLLAEGTNTPIYVVLAFAAALACGALWSLMGSRAQLLSEAVIQIFLTIALYRLYLLLIDVGLGEVKKSPPLRLRVGPCCCWPCLPFPELEMNSSNLSWLQTIVLQLPIVQTLVYCIFIFMTVENPLIAARYGVFLQPLAVTSILVGLYGLSITVMTLQEVSPGSNLRHKAAVVQMVLLFSKLQGFIIKSLAGTGLFPCNPPITPLVYANFTYNALMLIEMLFLCYAARLVYGEDEDGNCEGLRSLAGGRRTPGDNSPPDNADAALDGARSDAKIAAAAAAAAAAAGTRIELDRHNQLTNNNELSTNAGQNLTLNIRLASVIA